MNASQLTSFLGRSAAVRTTPCLNNRRNRLHGRTGSGFFLRGRLSFLHLRSLSAALRNTTFASTTPCVAALGRRRNSRRSPLRPRLGLGVGGRRLLHRHDVLDRFVGSFSRRTDSLGGLRGAAAAPGRDAGVGRTRRRRGERRRFRVAECSSPRSRSNFISFFRLSALDLALRP